VMVRLQDRGFWPSLLIPAFVLFFQMLYPFRWVNDRRKRLAGAAGGCVLLRRAALERIGGFAALKGALIDDCTLAALIKDPGQQAIWLGLSASQYSIRPYDGLSDIWTMVARTAYTQLHHSPWRLVGTVIGMVLVFLMAPIGLGLGILTTSPIAVALAIVIWGMMIVTYIPMLRWFGRPWEAACLLPFAACFYTLMTIDSARKHWQGDGGHWKGRAQADP
ncbi:MAG: glycosyltransferase, partial [Pseudomonadota bacterium]